MNVFKRSMLYITRKKIKSIIMLFILFGISTAVLSGISLKKAANVAKESVVKDIDNRFEMKADFTKNLDDSVPQSLVEKIAKVDGIKGYDGIIEAVALDFKELTKVDSEKDVVKYSDDYKYEDLFYMEAHTSTEFDSKFVSKSFKLVEGRHIVETDKNKVLIHKALAEKNNLKVGDKIKGTKNIVDNVASKTSPNEYEYEIVGIFESANTERAGHKAEISENLILADMNSIKTLYGYSDGNIKYTSIIFNTSDKVDKVISNVKKLSVDWSKYTISKSEDTFLALTKSFDALEKIVNIILFGSFIVGIIILSLILAFWIQGRVHETGILLSMGVSKINIISQYIIELLLISVIAFGGSYFSSKAISQNIGTAIVNQASKQAVQDVKSGFGGFSFGNDANTNLLTHTVSEIDVKVDGKEVFYVYILGAGIIVISVLISSASIIRLKPKEILSKMS